jgi:hypothetical protein
MDVTKNTRPISLHFTALTALTLALTMGCSVSAPEKVGSSQELGLSYGDPGECSAPDWGVDVFEQLAQALCTNKSDYKSTDPAAPTGKHWAVCDTSLWVQGPCPAQGGDILSMQIGDLQSCWAGVNTIAPVITSAGFCGVSPDAGHVTLNWNTWTFFGRPGGGCGSNCM